MSPRNGPKSFDRVNTTRTDDLHYKNNNNFGYLIVCLKIVTMKNNECNGPSIPLWINFNWRNCSTNNINN